MNFTFKIKHLLKETSKQRSQFVFNKTAKQSSDLQYNLNY